MLFCNLGCREKAQPHLVAKNRLEAKFESLFFGHFLEKQSSCMYPV